MVEAQLKLPVAEERIPDFYRGRCVLVTGGSGFVGRVLLEKLLRSCPDLHTVYLILRPRKGVLPQDRLKKLTDVPLFDRLRAERPKALEKVRVVAGDLSQPGLGLSAADALLLCERVSIVFHLAASVRFDDPLQVAVRNNTRSTKDLLELAMQMPLLKSFVHVSTTFCNVGLKEYEEKLYPAPADWKVIVEAVENFDPLQLRALTKHILGDYANTYTFSKILAEHIVNEYKDQLPIGIVRPSVVIGTYEEPFPSWTDNFNGPVGLLTCAAKGVCRTAYADPDTYLDYIPCDILVKGLIVSSWDIARRGVGEMTVYQGSQYDVARLTQGNIASVGNELIEELPLSETLYHPGGDSTTNIWLFYVQFLFLHLLPAWPVDAYFRASGRKPMLVRLQRRIYLANMSLWYFGTRNWNFVNQRFLDLEQKLTKSDRNDFAYNMHLLDSRELMKRGYQGVRMYLLNETDDKLPAARRRYKRTRLVHLTLKTLFHFAVMWIGLNTLLVILWRLL